MKGLVFDNVESIQDVCQIVQENIDRIIYLPDDILNYHYQSLSHLDDGKQERFLNFVHYADHQFSPYGSSGFFRQKLSTILIAATYFHQFYEQVSDYTDGELSILAKYSFIDSADKYSDFLVRFPQQVLSIIETRASEFPRRDDLILWYDYSLERGKDKTYLQNKLQSDDLEQLLQESFQIQTQIIEEVENNDSRRF